MKKICVFAGSNPGIHVKYRQHAQQLGEALVQNGYELVYGGSNVGLMGTVADTVLHHGGRVTGVIPAGLFRKEVVHTGLSQLIEVADMHQRKAKMSELADAYVALPGGYGTFEELFEVVSWAQLGIHRKPIGLLDVEGYYQPMMNLIRHAVKAGFVQEVHTKLLVSAADAATLLKKIEAYRVPEFGRKWKLAVNVQDNS